jgi:uncharacterized protein
MSLLRRHAERARVGEPTITVFNLTRNVEIADRVQKAGDARNRRKGLLGRTSLPKGEGLWIIPCEAVHTFWMRFSIDLIFIDRQGQVLKLRENVRPWRLCGCLRAHSVIELPGGTIHETRTQRGDTLRLEPR